ncbi:MAG: phosphate ABC transporter substrate-binding protein [Betaproteobacteria bacterium]|nr:phosphate ABC transporter substrate-binding protein [Betaproteobacteria bacterium]
MLIANARMYTSAGPAAKAAWREILHWIVARSGVPMDVIDHDPPELLADLWRREDLGAAMMCGLPLALRQPRPTVVAAPVPSPARYAGRPVYFSDILVPAGSPARTLEDTFGGTVGFTLEDSMSGCVSLRVLLERYRTPERPHLYSNIVGNLVHVRGIVEAVGSGRVDVGCADSYVMDLLRKHDPAFAARVRAIGMTDAAPIPPFVATATLDPEALERLRAAFRAAGREPGLAAARSDALVADFVVPEASAYDVFHRIHGISERHAGVW